MRCSLKEERRIQIRKNRGYPSPGRRKGDFDARATVTAKVIAAIVFIMNALYFLGDILVSGTGNCV